MKKLASSIANLLSENGVIENEKIELCSYGIELFCLSFFEILAVLILSIITHNFFQILLFFLAFIPLRIYAGGFHAETRISCFMVLIFVYLAVTVLLIFMPVELIGAVSLVQSLVSMVVVTVLAPVKNAKKTLKKIEISKFRKISIVICTIETLIIVAIFILGNPNSMLLGFSYGQAAVALSMVAAEIKSKRKEM